MEIDVVKEKILSFHPYSFYFVEQFYQSIAEMSSFYCKIEDDDFLLILNFFTTISKNIDISADINVELLYKMIIIAQRVAKKKSSQHGLKGQPI